MKQLTKSQTGELVRLERVVEDGLKTFIDVGQALLKIKLLCEFSQEEFGAYARKRFGIGRRRGDQLIAAAQIADGLSGTIVPANEGQARALTVVAPELRDEVLAAAAADGPLTAAKILDVAAGILGCANQDELRAAIEASKRQAESAAAGRRANAGLPNLAATKALILKRARQALEHSRTFGADAARGAELIDKGIAAWELDLIV